MAFQTATSRNLSFDRNVQRGSPRKEVTSEYLATVLAHPVNDDYNTYLQKY